MRTRKIRELFHRSDNITSLIMLCYQRKSFAALTNKFSAGRPSDKNARRPDSNFKVSK